VGRKEKDGKEEVKGEDERETVTGRRERKSPFFEHWIF